MIKLIEYFKSPKIYNALAIEYKGEVASLKKCLTIKESINKKFKTYEFNLVSNVSGEIMCEMSLTGSEMENITVSNQGQFTVNSRTFSLVRAR